MSEIWILGATGRSARIVAAKLAAQNFPLVLVGRDAARLADVAREVGGQSRVVVAGSVAAMAKEVAGSAASVVVNTVGPFVDTAIPIVQACSRGTHYVDISNELFSFVDLFAKNNDAVANGKCIVTGAGWGVLGTESTVLKLCKDRPTPQTVRVDMIPYLEADGTALGPTVAASIIESLPKGGRRYRRGRLVRAAFGSEPERFTLPDGVATATASAPTGELVAAQRASGAPSVVAASSIAPSGRIARVGFVLLGLVMRSRALRRFAIRRMANLRGTFESGGSKNSWARAKVTWRDGTKREAWLRAGDGTAFTTSVMAEVAARLARGEGRPGVFTPGALFGAELAEVAGGTFILGENK